MKKWMMIPALAGVVALGGVALVANADKADNWLTESYVSVQDVEKKAVEAVGGIVTDIELDSEDEGFIYEVDVQVDEIEYELDIDAVSGEVLRTKQDDDDDKIISTTKREAVSNSNKDHLTIDQVIAIAKKKVQGVVTDVELDTEDGRLQYEIDIQDGNVEYEFEIDAYTGEILEFERDED
ncbi:PepSY domain-containing protein [Sporosarcina sp. CAU 1771]